MTEDIIEILSEDDDVLDFILSIDDKDQIKKLLKDLDSTKNDDVILPLKLTRTGEDNLKMTTYHVIVKSVNEDDGGLMLFSSLNHEAIIDHLRLVYDALPDSAKKWFGLKVEQTAILLRKLYVTL